MSSINLLAPINSLGYGVVGTQLALALARAGAEPALWPIGPVECHPSNVEAIRTMMARTASYAHFGPSLRVWHQFDLAQHVGDGVHAAMPIFELDRFKPNERHHLLGQDLILATCPWAREVLADNGIPEDRIRVVPLGVDTSTFHPMEPRPPAALAEPLRSRPTVFLGIGKWELRKGHDFLIEAFERAFGPEDNVLLVMHAVNPCFADPARGRAYNEQWRRLYLSGPMSHRVILTSERLPDSAAVASLMSWADCGVFVSRAEGWNLELGEMLAMGKHVIVTDYSGHQEMANKDNAHLVGVREREVAHDGVWFDATNPAWDGQPGCWARLGKAQQEELISHLRSVYRAHQEGALRPNQAGIDHMASLTWDHTARRVLEVLG